MTLPYVLLASLEKQIDIPTDGTLSKTVFQDERLKAVLFGFSAGQEMSEHTAATPAVVHFLTGEAEVILGTDTISAQPGTWIHMSPQLPHSIRTKTPAIMLLLLIKPTPAIKTD